jgi:polyhydroxybutyrate depolymerase
VQVPTSYNANTALPVTLLFHGAGGLAEDSQGWNYQNAVTGANQAGIYVFPQGLMQPNGNISQYGWDMTDSGVDIQFMDAINQYLQATYCVDKNKIFAAGFSWGGDFTNLYACVETFYEQWPPCPEEPAAAMETARRQCRQFVILGDPWIPFILRPN